MHVLLDEMRRNLCIESEFLTEEKYDSIKRASQEWLKVPWALTDETGIYSGTAYAGRRPKFEPGAGGDLYVSGLGAYGRWLRRHGSIPAPRPSTEARRRRNRHRSAAESDGRRRDPREDQGAEPPDRLPDSGEPDRMARGHRRIPCTRPDPR